MTSKPNYAAEAAHLLLDNWGIKPGDVLYTTTLHTSRSGMTRHIKVVHIDKDGPHDISHLVARATGQRVARDGGVVVGGCGMDMGFATVYSLSRTLFPDGHACTGDRTCHSNDHSNDYNHAMRLAREELGTAFTVPHETLRAKADEMRQRHGLDYIKGRHHSDGGYAISQRWL